MFVLLFLVWIFSCASASQVPVCTSVHQSGFVTAVFSSSPTDAIANYSFDLSVTFNENNPSFPNTLKVTNFMEWYNDTTLYKRVSPWSFSFFENVDKLVDCQTMNNCTLQFPNGIIEYFYKYSFQNEQDWGTYVSGPQVFVSDGTFFNGENANLWDPPNSVCMNPETAYHVYIWANSCCTKFEYVNVPDATSEICQEFETITTVVDPAYTTPINLLAHYSVLPNALQIDIALLTAPDNIFIYDFYADHPDVSYTNGDQTNKNISLQMDLTQGNQYEFIFNYKPDAYKWDSNMKYQGLIVGEIINHNGVLLKNVNKTFTTADPCWTKNAIVPFTNSTYQSSFCCTTFKTVTLPTTTPPTTTNPPIDPRSNEIGTSCSNDTKSAYLDIIFVIDTSNAMGQVNLNAVGAQITSLMLKFTIAQNGNHTSRAGIVTYATNYSSVYELKDVTDISAFQKALKHLVEHPKDSGGKVQQALGFAFKLLQNQTSDRIPLIVLVAAAYDPSGLKDKTSDVIKENGITIVVIHYVYDNNDDLSKALQNISSPGYYYNTNQNDLGLLTYALAQINCACPTGWMQFSVYNKEWNNFTRYADCHYSDGTASNPAVANDFCDPGTLIALTSLQKLDFVTDSFIPTNDALKGMKNFSTGLHKDANSKWMWWGYNGTEYPVGNYPGMSMAPAPNDNFGYMLNYKGFNWKLVTANADDIQLPYICQQRACDSEYICSRN